MTEFENEAPKTPDKEKKVKFPSLTGFSLTSGKDGDKVKIRTWLNCRDPYPLEMKLLLTQSTLDDLVYPEVIDRARNGKLPADFQLRNAHVFMYADESRNEVLLNDEVRFLAHIITKNGKEIKPMESVKYDDIADVAGLYPSEKNDPNAAHIMLLRLSERWYYASNFVYNSEIVRTKFEQSKDFFETAKISANEKRWGPMVDTLYSATELAIQSCLLLIHRGKFSIYQDHPSTKKQFYAHSDAGNLDQKYKKHFSNLQGLRLKARYQRGVHGRKFEVVEPEVISLFNLTNDLMNYVNSLLRSKDISRNPNEAGGYVIQIGQG